MIYKIIVENLNELGDYFNIASSKFEFIFGNGSLFISSDLDKKQINSFFKKNKKQNHAVIQINADNLKFETQTIIEWCRDRFVKEDIKKFENEKQEQLRAYSKFIDDFDSQLQKILNKEEEEYREEGDNGKERNC